MSSGWRPALVKNATTDRASVLSSSAMARESRSGAGRGVGSGGGVGARTALAREGSRGGKHGTRICEFYKVFVKRMKASEEDS